MSPPLSTLSSEEADAICMRNQVESPFLRLPGEIRNKIYAYALKVDYIAAEVDFYVSRSNDYGIRYYFNDYRPNRLSLEVYGYGSDQKQPTPLSVVLSITRVCRQIRAESEVLMYTLNPLRMKLDVLLYSVHSFPTQVRTVVKSLTIDMHWWAMRREAFELSTLKDFKALRNISIIYDGKPPLPENWTQTVEAGVKRWAGKDVEVAFEPVFVQGWPS